MIEGVHGVLLVLTEGAFKAVPAFPDRRSTMRHRIEPECLSPMARAAQCGKDVGSARKARGDSMVGEVHCPLAALAGMLCQACQPLLRTLEILAGEAVEVEWCGIRTLRVHLFTIR